MRPARLLGVLVLAAALIPASAAADPYPVVNLAGSGAGSLRQAIVDANARPGEDSIPIAATGSIKLAEPLPTITDSVAIVGPGPVFLTVERNATAEFRIFDFADGITASLTGVTVTGGAAPQGAGIRNGSGNLSLTRVVVAGNEAEHEGSPGTGVPGAEAEGGGIFSAGPLTVRESVVRDNSATAIGGGTLTSALGAGVMARGPVTVDRSTISGNAAEAHGEGGGHSRALGGGLSATGEPALVERSTFSGNSVVADTSSTNEARGGGLQGDELSLTSSTVTGNSLFSIGTATGANIEFGGTTSIRNTIVANPLGAASCGKPHDSSGFNLDEDGSCGFGQATDLAKVAVGLDPVLRENGGPTPTHALLPGSAAQDRGSAFASPIDQRGLPRPVDFATASNTEGGDGSDIGAFEVQAPPVLAPGPKPILVSTVPADTQPPNTRVVSGPARVTFKRLARFRFASTEAQSSFQCKVDDRRWRRCTSPYARKVSAGGDAGKKHVFKVRATDRFGNVDPTPARFGWRVKRIDG